MLHAPRHHHRDALVPPLLILASLVLSLASRECGHQVWVAVFQKQRSAVHGGSAA